MKCPFEISWEQVTPEQARTWLEKHNPHNRALRGDAVTTFSQDMKTNRWSPNHQGLAFNQRGELIDGQHRLAAVAQSGVPIWTLVFRNVPDRIAGVAAMLMETVDRGNTRSLGDLLRLEYGIKEQPNVVAAGLLQIARMCINHPNHQAKRSTMPQLALVLEHFGPAVRWAMSVRPAQLGLRTMTVWASMAFAYAAKPRETMAFAERLVSGAGLAMESPVLTLRNELLRGALDHGGVQDRWNYGAKVLAALEADIEGAPLRSLPPGQIAAQALQWWRDWQTSRVETIAAAFPLMKPVDEKRTKLATRAVTERLRSVEPAAPAVVGSTKVTKASELKVTPAAARLLASR